MTPISNSALSEYLTNIATAYEIKNKGRFRTVAYENAADTVLTYPENIYDLWLKNPQVLDSIPNIGPSIQKKIDYLFRTDKPYPKLKSVFSGIHPAVFTFTKINGIGPAVAQKLTQAFVFSKSDPARALDQLVSYAQKGKIEKLEGFGKKSEESILENTLSFLGRCSRMPLAEAKQLANKIIDYLKVKFPDVLFVPLGSLRRQAVTVGDIDIAAASTKAAAIVSYFLEYPDSVQTIDRGSHKASIRLLHDIHVDLMVKPPQTFGALLQHFTGSRQHNILLRKYALKLGYSLSEYGIRDIKTGVVHHFDTEEKFYNFLGLNYIPPEERLGENEIEKYQK